MNKDHLNIFKMSSWVKDFFIKEGFTEVYTPPIVENPGMETHIHPFQVHSVVNNKLRDLYLHTSPEFHMKELLADGMDKIFNLSYAFRDEPSSATHRHQFLMLEWYRSNQTYQKIMNDCEHLINHVIKEGVKNNFSVRENLKLEKITIQELFLKVINIDILEYLDKEKLRSLIDSKFKSVPLPKEDLSWDDYYFLLFLNIIEPELKNFPLILLYEFPHHLSALSTLKKSDKRVCERFEIYINGIEVCNCFNELTDLHVQKKRFNNQAEEKQNLYKYNLPEPQRFYKSLKNLPPSAGIALGIERLYMSLFKIKNPFWD